MSKFYLFCKPLCFYYAFSLAVLVCFRARFYQELYIYKAGFVFCILRALWIIKWIYLKKRLQTSHKFWLKGITFLEGAFKYDLQSYLIHLTYSDLFNGFTFGMFFLMHCTLGLILIDHDCG